MAVTIYDIAEKAGLSHATVSMALRDLPKIKPETRARVQALARRMGYIPNQAAVALKTGNSNMLALVVPELYATAHRQFMERLKSNCLEAGWHISIHELTADPPEQRRIMEYVCDNDFLAAVTFMYDYATIGDIIEKMLAMHRPVVVVGAPKDLVMHPGMLPVEIDNLSCIRQCIGKLFELGHSKILHTAFCNSDSAVNKLIAELVREHGVTDWDPIFRCIDKLRPVTAEDGYAVAAKLLQERPDTTAIQCINDSFAFGLMKGLQEHGKRVPEDISICGSDNTFIAKYNSPPISSIDMGQHEAADIVCNFLQKQLQEQDWETVPGIYRVPGKFIMRETTGKAPGKTDL